MSCILYKVRPLCEQLIWVCPTEDCILPTMFSDFVHISTDSIHGSSDTHDLPGEFCFSTPLVSLNTQRHWRMVLCVGELPPYSCWKFHCTLATDRFYKSDNTRRLLLWVRHFFAMEWWSQRLYVISMSMQAALFSIEKNKLKVVWIKFNKLLIYSKLTGFT